MLVAYLVVASAGTLLLAAGPGHARARWPRACSTWSTARWWRRRGSCWPTASPAARGGSDLLQPRPLGGGWAPLGAAFFVAAVAVAGVPPLAGFMGKALLLQAAGAAPLAAWVVAGGAGVQPGGDGGAGARRQRASSGSRRRPAAPAGGRTRRRAPHAHARWPSALLAAAVLAAALAAGPIAAYTGAAAQQLLQRQGYIDAVLGALPAPPAWDVRREMRERGDAK